MANTRAVFSLLIALSAFSLLLPQCIHAHPLKVCMFDAIYQLGDSISDTGNLIRENPVFPCSRLPYGETFFKKATGRCSNGLLMIDYIGKNETCSCLSFFLVLFSCWIIKRTQKIVRCLWIF